VTGSCKHDNYTSGSANVGDSLDQLSSYQLLKKDSAPWNYLISKTMVWLRIDIKKQNYHS
jgi:hypothetical protein